MEVVKLNDMEQEYAHLSANLQLLRRNPSLIGMISNNLLMNLQRLNYYTIFSLYFDSLGHSFQTCPRRVVRSCDVYRKKPCRRYD